MNSKLAGRQGEAAAAEYLKRAGCSVIGMNYSTRFGEIDIIAEDSENLIFAEVKMRKSAAFAEAREFVDERKRARLRTTAEIWLAANGTEKPARFDVIEVYTAGGKINHIKDAFQ